MMIVILLLGIIYFNIKLEDMKKKTFVDKFKTSKFEQNGKDGI
jgi:hypothetical protein